ncbi:tripartite tricarboxylate transporter substrate binding protein [Bordetella bronchialis]|uniref:MFS transporter n=1 Tax=Bordetella bronchialis TaxID=463025 RepID=A0ABN4R715_9BORD|nr:tripartite tricarboxylate transporter substrate binding protein [Bordetella bronchialis]ANN67428.1 MFS transporter [Bordetella bronchialis]
MQYQNIARRCGALLATACMAAATATAAAAPAADGAGTYPDNAMRIIVPYTPGGFNDTMARVLGKKLTEAWHQPVIVENRPGAGTVVGTEAGARAAPDGYTLVVVGFPLVVNQYIYPKLPYDTQRDFVPVLLAGQTPNVLLVRAESPIKSLPDLVARAKASPGKMNYASAGNGTSLHLAMEYFKNVTGTDMNQIPYKGSAPMVTALLGGQVDVMFDNLPNALPQIKAGKMRSLGITTAKRLPSVPDIPTVAEQGYPGFEVAVWYGLAVPRGTPTAIVEKLNAQLNKALQDEDVKSVFAAQGVQVLGGSTADFEKFFQAQDAKWAPVIKKAGIRAE